MCKTHLADANQLLEVPQNNIMEQQGCSSHQEPPPSPQPQKLTPLSSPQLGGGTLLGIGIWVTVDGKSFLEIFGSLSSSVMQVVNVSYFLIVIGCILVVIGFLGCCSAQKESKCLLMTVRICQCLVMLYQSLLDVGCWCGRSGR